MISDPYAVLGVSRTATKEEIKKAYRAMAKKYHPDLHPNDPQAAAKMNEINEAYDMINNPEKYSRMRAQQQAQQSYSQGYSSQGGNYREYHYDSSSDDPFEMFNEMFRNFYGGYYSDQNQSDSSYRDGYDSNNSQWQNSWGRRQSSGGCLLRILRFIGIIIIVNLLLRACGGLFFSPFYYYSPYPGNQYEQYQEQFQPNQNNQGVSDL